MPERGAELTLVHVVDDDQPSGPVALETREAERILRELIGAMPELRHIRCRPLVVAGDPFDALLRTAASEADLIVMGAHRRQLLRDIFIGTSVERVIRTGPILYSWPIGRRAGRIGRSWPLSICRSRPPMRSEPA
ncbi:MAG: universal stress protein [Rhodopila sp.]